jgi:BirA family biotin operon repressor/biotin-[acetyl-CoA-carboxylase] ligase
MAFYFLQETASTIDDARDPIFRHGDLIAAEYQTAGRGQRGHAWSSAAGKNLTFSVVLEPSHLAVEQQFLLLRAVALALTDTLADYGIASRIKWTNDIYVGDRKITGVLIDHNIHEGRIVRSGVGVGLNVNQTLFEEWLPNPTSMSLETGVEYDRSEVLERFHRKLMERYSMADSTQREQLCRDYHSLIYRLDTPARFSLPDGRLFTGTIRGVDPSGALMVEDERGTLRPYPFQEIAFII